MPQARTSSTKPPERPSHTKPVERKKHVKTDDDNFEEFLSEELDLKDYALEKDDRHILDDLNKLKKELFRRKS